VFLPGGESKGRKARDSDVLEGLCASLHLALGRRHSQLPASLAIAIAQRLPSVAWRVSDTLLDLTAPDTPAFGRSIAFDSLAHLFHNKPAIGEQDASKTSDVAAKLLESCNKVFEGPIDKSGKTHRVMSSAVAAAQAVATANVQGALALPSDHSDLVTRLSALSELPTHLTTAIARLLKTLKAMQHKTPKKTQQTPSKRTSTKRPAVSGAAKTTRQKR